MMSIRTRHPTASGKALTQAVDVHLLPKILLREHLDGGLRPTTITDLAAELSYDDTSRLATHMTSRPGSTAEHSGEICQNI